jgi:hypothetical protein
VGTEFDDDLEDIEGLLDLDFDAYLGEPSEDELPADRKATLPPRWSQLIRAVSHASTLNLGNPDRPLFKIGRFGGIVPRGRGSYGLVFEVHDPDLDRRVALKLCLTSGPAAEAAIMHEARLLAKLSHPNIITVYETGRYGDDVFFVMELITGRRNSGYDLINKQPRWQDAVNIYIAAGSGLAAAHDANIVHGDFKPGNLLIDQLCERPRVADFGFARIILDHAPADEREQIKFNIGTLPYMAPEVLRGQPGDQLSDQWSFCVSLWETLEGWRPFMGNSVELLLESIAQGELVAEQPEDKVPEALRSVLRVGLSVDPSERFDDMHELLGALRKLTQPRQQGVMIAAPEAPRRRLLGGPDEPPRRGIFFLATLLAFTVMLGSLTSAVLLSHDDEGRSLPDVPALEMGERVFGEVLTLIQAGGYDVADAKWESEVIRRDGLGHRSVDASLQVARAFFQAAQSLEDTKPIDAKVAGTYAHSWANTAATDLRELGEDDTSAEALVSQTLRFKPD